MLFNKFKVFYLNKNLNKNNILESIKRESFKPIFGSSLNSEGFCNLHDFTEDLLIEVKNTLRLRLKKQEKILPSFVVNNKLKEKVLLIEKEQKRKVGNREKKDIKDNIIFELLPQAFSKISYADIIIDANNKFLFINEISNNRVDNILIKLKRSIQEFNISLINTKYNPSDVMTSWLLNGDGNGNFIIDDVCELKSYDINNEANIKINKQDLQANEIISLVKNNKKVTKLGLIWDNKISFIIDENLSIQKIKFLDILKEKINYNEDDMQELFLSNHILMIENFSLLLKELILEFGCLL